MPEVTVLSQKWDGSPHRLMHAAELGTDAAGTWLWVREGARVETVSGSYRAAAALRLLQPGRRWSAYFSPARPDVGRPNQVYVDITTPTVRTSDVFTFIDLDLDVEQLDDGPVKVLDRDEFSLHAERHRYPADVIETAETVCDAVATAVHHGEHPFDGSHLRWLARVRRG